jgi:hypothetical protein
MSNRSSIALNCSVLSVGGGGEGVCGSTAWAACAVEFRTGGTDTGVTGRGSGATGIGCDASCGTVAACSSSSESVFSSSREVHFQHLRLLVSLF